MNKLTKFNSVEFLGKNIFPSDVQELEGVIYVSNEIEFISFKCPCGCERKVVLPLTSWGWNYTMSDDKITISPNIKPNDNDNKDCQSNYQIVNNEILWIPDDIKVDIVIDNNTH